MYCSCPAGHYVPATALVILESDSIYTKNLKGIGIGNGWVNPYVQYAAYAKVRKGLGRKRLRRERNSKNSKRRERERERERKRERETDVRL